MSALPPKADICSAPADVRFVPKADIASALIADLGEVFVRPLSIQGLVTGNRMLNTDP
jgi:hypothetical protein